MSFNCKKCKYFTENKSNWNKHLKSNKHILKVLKATNPDNNVAKCCHKVATKSPVLEENKSYTCDDCNFSTLYRGSFYKHLNRCVKKELRETREKSEFQQVQKDIQIKDLTIQHQQQIIDMLRESLVNKGNNTSDTK